MINKITLNPLIDKLDLSSSRQDFEIIGVFNPGVTILNNKTILLLRVAERPIQMNPHYYSYPVFDKNTNSIIIRNIDKSSKGLDVSDPRVIKTPKQNYLTSISHLRVATSIDGINFAVESSPALQPDNEYEAFGIEDPRITCINGVYYITYSSASEFGIVTSMASTKDFKDFKRESILFTPDDKDVAIFPQKIGSKYYALHRPSTSEYGKPEIWISESTDLFSWGNHRHLVGVREEKWDNYRIGAGAVPFLTDKGWIEIYHGADKKNRYCIGALLLEQDKPWHVLARSEKPLLEPTEAYETKGFFGKVIFTCGCVVNGDNIRVYYGASDESIACALMQINDIYENLGV